MTWLTRSHRHVDRMASPWLIACFIESGAAFRHRDDRCNGGLLIKACERKDRDLRHPVRIVAAADTDRLDRDLRAAGGGDSMRLPQDNANHARQVDACDTPCAWRRQDLAHRP